MKLDTSLLKKTPVRIALGVLALILLVPVILPFFISTKDFQPMLEQQLSSTLGRKVTFGELNLHIFTGSLAAKNLSIADNPAFSSAPFLTADSIKIGVDLWPLIFSRKVSVTSLTIEKPQISLVRNAKNVWNFASLASGANGNTASTAGGSGTGTDLSVSKFALVDGSATIIAENTGRRTVYSNLKVTAEKVSLSSQFPVQISMDLPGKGTLKVDGSIGPIAHGDVSMTPLDAQLTVRDFDVSKTGFLDPSAGIGGIADVDAHLKAAGGKAHLSGTVKLTKAKMMRGGAPASVPISVDVDADYDLKSSGGQLNRGVVRVGRAQTLLTGTFAQKGLSELLDINAKGSGMPVTDLQDALPAVGVILPKGSQLKDGTANANLRAVGPADKLVITGTAGLENARLAGFDLGSNFQALSKLTGGSLATPDTVIEHFSSSVRVAPEGIQANNIDAVVQRLGEVTGSGTVSPSNELDFKMVGKIAGRLSIPFTVTGNSSRPKITLDFSGMLKNSFGSAKALANGAGSNLKKGLGGLFGKH